MDQEEIVMTPTKKGKVTSIKFAKVKKTQMDESKVAHKGGGQHTGLVINKQSADDDGEIKPDLQLEFKCFLVDNKTGKHQPERRVLKFWFRPETDYLDKVTSAYEFFKELVKPDSFPRDYVGFIKKVMTQLKLGNYYPMLKVDVDLEPLEASQNSHPGPGMQKADDRPKELIVQEQLLLTLEQAYPNILPIEDLAKMCGADEAMVHDSLKVLQGRNLLKEMEQGKWVRKVLDNKTEVKVVKQMPMQTAGNRPTVAIITSKYYEKLAVDAMMTNKTTFVRFKTEGESNVYTLGDIGEHRVVSTKLPMIGRQMAAQISSGNTTTRLLGTFSDVEHVLLVGVCGGVPHYTDFYKHCRLGDVIAATPNDKGNMYIMCDKITHDETKGTMSYTLKSWSPKDQTVQETSNMLIDKHKRDSLHSTWESYIRDGQQLLQGQEVNFNRPSPDTDRLFMNIGGNDVIEVGHPPAPEEVEHWHKNGQPVIRRGPIGAGKPMVREDQLRIDFAARHSCAAFDTEFDQVIESIVGNRKDSFGFIRGVTDYLDGTKNVEWQPYASLAAAAFTKSLIEHLPPPGSCS